jgi:hypothetical protein
MKISDLIGILQDYLNTHGDLPVLTPVLYDTDTLDEPQDITVLDGDSDDSQPENHPTGLYLYIGGQY